MGGRIQERTLEERAKTALAVATRQNCVKSDPKRGHGHRRGTK